MSLENAAVACSTHIMNKDSNYRQQGVIHSISNSHSNGQNIVKTHTVLHSDSSDSLTDNTQNGNTEHT